LVAHPRTTLRTAEGRCRTGSGTADPAPTRSSTQPARSLFHATDSCSTAPVDQRVARLGGSGTSPWHQHCSSVTPGSLVWRCAGLPARPERGEASRPATTAPVLVHSGCLRAVDFGKIGSRSATGDGLGGTAVLSRCMCARARPRRPSLSSVCICMRPPIGLLESVSGARLPVSPAPGSSSGTLASTLSATERGQARTRAGSNSGCSHGLQGFGRWAADRRRHGLGLAYSVELK
jgi:hypothetical protein